MSSEVKKGVGEFGEPTGNDVIRDAIKRGLRLNSLGQIVLPSGKIMKVGRESRGYKMASVWGLGKRLPQGA